MILNVIFHPGINTSHFPKTKYIKSNGPALIMVCPFIYCWIIGLEKESGDPDYMKEEMDTQIG
jgi:hypothetical protein